MPGSALLPGAWFQCIKKIYFCHGSYWQLDPANVEVCHRAPALKVRSWVSPDQALTARMIDDRYCPSFDVRFMFSSVLLLRVFGSATCFDLDSVW